MKVMAKKSQIDKFRETARSAESDESESRFNRALERVARAAQSKGKTDPKPRKAKQR
jgi:hypothetical protein